MRTPRLSGFAARVVGVAVAVLLAAGLASAFRAGAAEIVEPIRFARGASGAEVEGAVLRGERAMYSIEARAGQRLSLRMTAVENNAVFQVYAPGARPERRDYGLEILGTALAGAAEGDDTTEWAGSLPITGGYLLVVGASRGNATYRLTISVH